MILEFELMSFFSFIDFSQEKKGRDLLAPHATLAIFFAPAYA